MTSQNFLRCARCCHEHDGSLMRHNKNERTFALITASDVPRSDDGRINICHFCQRSAWFVGSFTELLIIDLYNQAKIAMRSQLKPDRSDIWFRRRSKYGLRGPRAT